MGGCLLACTYVIVALYGGVCVVSGRYPPVPTCRRLASLMGVPTSKVRTWFANKRARAKTSTTHAPVPLLSKRRFTPEQRALLRVHFEQDKCVCG